MSDLSTIVQLRDSDFRHNFFYFKKSFAKGGALYKETCKQLTNYIVKNGLFLPDGSIKCDVFLKRYCNTDVVSFFTLAKHLTLIYI